MASGTMVVDSAFTQISAALDYDECERMLADGAPFESVRMLAVAQAEAAYTNDHGPESTRETELLVQTAPIRKVAA
jgi:hypothetical protein